MRFTYRSLVKVVVFCLATGVLVAVVGITFARVRIEDATTYHAVVTDASGLESGADVRGSGVSIGRVSAVERREEGGVLVTFTAAADVQLTDKTQARIRYANLTGDRYLELTNGAGGTALEDGETIPVSRTLPALELDDFFAGFDPLMQALDPDEVNQLAQNLIAVTQGQAGSVQQMLSSVALFTNGLAERDKLVGDVIVNLADALSVIDGKKSEFEKLIVGLSHLVDGLATDRTSIGTSIAGMSRLSSQVTDLLLITRPGIRNDLRHIGTMSRNLNTQLPLIKDILDGVAPAVHEAGRLGPYGSFFNFYLCSVRVRVVDKDDPEGTDSGIYSPLVMSTAKRCEFPKKGEE